MQIERATLTPTGPASETTFLIFREQLRKRLIIRTRMNVTDSALAKEYSLGLWTTRCVASPVRSCGRRAHVDETTNRFCPTRCRRRGSDEYTHIHTSSCILNAHTRSRMYNIVLTCISFAPTIIVLTACWTCASAFPYPFA